MQVRFTSPQTLASGCSFAASAPEIKEDLVRSSCQQFQVEHDPVSQARYFPELMSLILGNTCVRRISNFFRCLGLSEFYPAQRDYPLLPPSSESLALAKSYAPILSSISESQANSAQLNKAELKYELLPPQQDRNYFSLVYYMGFPKEKMPMPFFDLVYDWLRPILYGSVKDWEAVQIDLDPHSKEPIAISYETSNYTEDNSSYQTIRSEDLHLLCKVSKQADGNWVKTVWQKNGAVHQCPTENPFVTGGARPCLTVVSWNGSFDIASEVAEKPNLKTFRLSTNKVQFLDLDTYRQEGMDLRTSWVSERKFGKFLLTLASRKA